MTNKEELIVDDFYKEIRELAEEKGFEPDENDEAD